MEGMFLYSREFVRPRSIFPARVWVSNEEEPLQIYLTSAFVERTWMGYGVGAYISGISARDSSLWESFYRSCAAARFEQLRQCVQSERMVRNRRVLAVDGALNQLAMQALRKQGLEVLHAPSPTDALALLQSKRIDVLVSDLQRPGLDGMALCCHINRERLPTRTVLLTSSAAPREFLLGMYAGATRVVAKPCSNELLGARIVDLLQQRPPASRPAPALSGSPEDLDDDAHASGHLAGRQLVGIRTSSAVKAVRRASQSLAEACRYVSERLSRRAAV